MQELRKSQNQIERQPDVEYKVQENIIPTRRFSWLQAPEGSSKFLWHEWA